MTGATKVIVFWAAVAAGLVACGGGDDAAPGDASHLALLRGAGEVRLEDVSFEQGQMLVRVAPAATARREDCGDLVLVSFEGTATTLAEDVVMPRTGAVNGNFAALSPDGSRVAYVANECPMGSWSLRVIDTDGSDGAELADSVGIIESWVGSGRVLFGRGSADGVTLWEVGGDGTGLREANAGPVVDVSPDGGTYALFGSEGSLTFEPAGGDSFGVSGMPVSFEGRMFSPDGRSFLFLHPIAEGSFELRVAGMDTRDDRLLLSFDELGDVWPLSAAAWSPDARRVLLTGGLPEGAALLLDVGTLGTSAVAVEDVVSAAYWSGPLVFYAGAQGVWAASADGGDEGAGALDELRRAFPQPLQAGPE